MPNKINMVYRALKRLIRTFSWRKARFLWNDLDLDVRRFDDDMLLVQLGYYGHHTEKALKHHNRGERGKGKRDKLFLLLNEAKRRGIDEPEVITWGERLVKYFDNNKAIYLEEISGINESEYKEQFLDFISQRTTTRFWQPIEVDDDIIRNILKVAMSSALSCNRQSLKFCIKKNSLESIVVGDSNNNSMFAKAPVTIYIADDGRFFPEKYGNALDVGGVCSLIQLAASAYGLSGSWIYHSESYNQDKIKKELGLANHMYIYSSITLGYPLDKQEKPPRYSVERFII